MTAPTQGQSSCDPLLYALVHTGTPGDVEFYARQCQDAERVLELGCGYGRLVVELASAGHRVTGLERHAGLLALARDSLVQLEPAAEARVELRQGDMRDFDLGAQFDRILLPHSGIYCLLEDADLEACLGCVRRHLAPGGRLLLDAYAADGFHVRCRPEDHPEDRLDEIGLIACGGVVYDVYERSTWDRDAQRMVATYVHVPDQDPSRAIEYAIEQRYLLRSQLEALLVRCGFRVHAVAGDFQGEPYDDESEVLVVVAD